MQKQQSVEQYKKCQIVLYNVVDRTYQAHNTCYIEDCGPGDPRVLSADFLYSY